MKIPMLRPAIAALRPNRRPDASDRGYDAKWKAAAAEFKLRHPYCLGCAALGRKIATEVVDHVQPHKGDQEQFWNTSMWQAACRWHHDVVKKQLEAMFIRGTISADALWLDSGAARSISMHEARVGTGVNSSDA